MDNHQLVIIDGGESFASDEAARLWLQKCDWDLMAKHPSWKKWLADGLSLDFQVIRPDMPNAMNAKYEEWKIWFEKYFRYILTPGVTEQSILERVEIKSKTSSRKLVFIGHSLGATFLVKYFSENYFPESIYALHLVSPAFDDAGFEPGTTLATFRPSSHTLAQLHRQIEYIHIWASTDDTIVPYDHAVRYHVNIVGSVLHTFHDRGHFVGQAHFVELFQELVK